MLKIAALIAAGIVAPPVQAFCGFYVAQANTKIFNKSSQVVLVRDQDRTVLTMVNDFTGDPKEFAVVVPVPTFLERDQIHVGDKAPVDHLDAYSAPRLVEYFDPDPCVVMERLRLKAAAASAPAGNAGGNALGVKVEASYTVGEYDIVILSAEQSNGLEQWLTQNNYKIPARAGPILESYIKQQLRFFVARVNLREKEKLGTTFLRPLQIAYESPKFMLPIRLGTVNANGPQDLFIFTLTKKGRVETTNYRTVKLPTDYDIPLYVKDIFPQFYKDMFSEAVKREDMRVLFTEYAWDMGWCDPCAADPLSPAELRSLGVFWVDETGPRPLPGGFRPRPIPNQAPNVFLTRLHVRYDAAHFPEDLVFQETADRSNFQGRFILRHPWTGSDTCDRAKEYTKSLPERRAKEAENLAHLTGWKIEDIRAKIKMPVPEEKWYKKLWRN